MLCYNGEAIHTRIPVNPHVVMTVPQLHAFLFLLFSATEWLLLLQRSVTKGRGPKHCVLAFRLHKSQLPNKHSRHGDRDRDIEAKVLAGKMLCFMMTVNHHECRHIIRKYGNMTNILTDPTGLKTKSFFFFHLHD